MDVRWSEVSHEELRRLPTPVRSRVDPDDVVLPDGYAIEPVIAGLSFPTSLACADDGSLFIGEGGSTWPTRPYLPARILRLDPGGKLEVFAVETLGGPRGMAIHQGHLYVSIKGGYFTRIVRYDLKSRKREMLIDKLPNGGWHEPGGPVFGPDGLMYFGQGSISLNGIPEPAGFTVDLAKHPWAKDVPGQDIVLTGNNAWSRNPASPYPYMVETGAYKPYGVPAKKGEVVKGELFCSTGIFRSRPDGSEPELLAWGVRNPFGMAINAAGDLYVSDNDYEEKGSRPIAEDPDRVWHIRNAKLPHGSVKTPDWYGFPDLCGDGLPAWHEKHRPLRGPPAAPLLENPPPWAGPAMYVTKPHTCLCKMDFCPDAFGYGGALFLCQFGSFVPLNAPRPEEATNGYNVVRIDVATGAGTTFLHNRKPGPASSHGGGGIERPVDCKFDRDGTSLWLLDFGAMSVQASHLTAFGHTGVLWRVRKTGGAA